MESSSTSSFFPNSKQGSSQVHTSKAGNKDGYSHHSNTEQLKVENTINPNLAPTAPMLPGSLNWHSSYAGPYGYQPAAYGFANISSLMAIDPALTQDNPYKAELLTEDSAQERGGEFSQRDIGDLKDLKVC
jgi:hypothetical protein